MEFLLGIIVGFMGCIFWLALVGILSYRREIRRLEGEHGPWYPNKSVCADGHKWCQEHAAEGKFHCERCGHVLEQ